MMRIRHDVTRFSGVDIHLFKEGTHFRLYEKLGSHVMEVGGLQGAYFAVWAPNAAAVSVVGDWNGWDPGTHPLAVRPDESGIWEGFIPGIGKGGRYKYHIFSRYGGYEAEKGDPFALYWEQPPQTASLVWDTSYAWGDVEWLKKRHAINGLDAPISIYEVHPGSWRRVAEENNRFLTYRELAHSLADHVLESGFTHVEFTPVMEHPFYGSWGYQITGYFAPTSRYGTPQDFMYLVDHLHSRGIGVILDWVPSHFPDNEHGLVYFDGSHLYEHPDPRLGFHAEWNSYIFNYGRHEVRAFLISNALFWFHAYHADALRVDAVASMLYLDYGRKDGEWVRNRFGGRENLDAISFLRKLNETVYGEFPDVQMIAEESTAWPMVSKPIYIGGLGFGMKWNMGWMHDTLDYFSCDPFYRKFRHNQLIFSIHYAFSENFILSLSHDEVVYGKRSLLARMPGDDWQKFANLRLLLGYLFTHPGKKLLFMGGEFGQWQEWYHEESLHWHLLNSPFHQGVLKWLRDLNGFYRRESSLYERDFGAEGFEWVDCSDWEQSVICFLRKSLTTPQTILVVCNFTPITRNDYRVGVPAGGVWKEVLNSDAVEYGGSGHGNLGCTEATKLPCHGRFHSLALTLPPLGILCFKREGEGRIRKDDGDDEMAAKGTP